MKNICKIVRISAWALVLFTLLEMFSGFFSSANFITNTFGADFSYKVHSVYTPLIFAVLVFAHSLGGFFMLIARNKSFNNIYIKFLGTAFWIIVLVSFTVLFFGQFSNNNKPKSTQGNTNTVQQESISNEAKEITISEVAKHNSKSDCWMIIDGKVYDITNYFGQHPGRDETMMPYCGKDGTDGYETKDKPRSQDHSYAADQLLIEYFVGNLTQ